MQVCIDNVEEKTQFLGTKVLAEDEKINMYLVHKREANIDKQFDYRKTSLKAQTPLQHQHLMLRNKNTFILLPRTQARPIITLNTDLQRLN